MVLFDKRFAPGLSRLGKPALRVFANRERTSASNEQRRSRPHQHPRSRNLSRSICFEAGARKWDGNASSAGRSSARRSSPPAARSRRACRIRCTPISSCPAIRPSPSSTRSSGCATAGASRRAASAPSSTGIRSSPCRSPSMWRRKGFPTASRCRRCRAPRSCRANRKSRTASCRRCRTRCAAISSASVRSSCIPSNMSATSRTRRASRCSICGCAPRRPLPDDPILHRCVLAYASDLTLLDTSLVAHGRTLFERGFQGASLDHAMWFHAPVQGR